MNNIQKAILTWKITYCLAITTYLRESHRPTTFTSKHGDGEQFSTPPPRLGEFSFEKGVYANPAGKYDHSGNSPATFHPDLSTTIDASPLLAALLLSSFLNVPAKAPGYNHPQHLSPNPYVALLLSQFGKYLPTREFGKTANLYAYSAANNYHNNKPFGAYKIYEDKDL